MRFVFLTLILIAPSFLFSASEVFNTCEKFQKRLSSATFATCSILYDNGDFKQFFSVGVFDDKHKYVEFNNNYSIECLLDRSDIDRFSMMVFATESIETMLLKYKDSCHYRQNANSEQFEDEIIGGFNKRKLNIINENFKLKAFKGRSILD